MAARQFGAKRDARRAVRRLVDLECAVYAELWGEAVAHQVSDVSEEGLWIQTDLLLEIGTEITLKAEIYEVDDYDVVLNGCMPAD